LVFGSKISWDDVEVVIEAANSQIDVLVHQAATYAHFSLVPREP